jgi:hypothetical protein
LFSQLPPMSSTMSGMPGDRPAMVSCGADTGSLAYHAGELEAVYKESLSMSFV